MDQIPYKTMHTVDNIRREINKFYSFPCSSLEENFSSHLGVPFTDLYETDQEIIISCDLPELQKREDITLPLASEKVKAVYENGVLTIFLPKGNARKTNQ